MKDFREVFNRIFFEIIPRITKLTNSWGQKAPVEICSKRGQLEQASQATVHGSPWMESPQPGQPDAVF